MMLLRVSIQMSAGLIRLLGSLCLLLTIAGAGPVAVAGPQVSTGKDALNDVSGMYTFLREGEFVQLTVEDGKLSGYVSRFGDSDSDKGQFIDQFFDKTSLVGNRLSFNTKTVHGVWYDFNGIIAIAPEKKPSEEGYRVIRGKLIQHTTDASGADKAMQRQVEFKAFPADMNR